VNKCRDFGVDRVRRRRGTMAGVEQMKKKLLPLLNMDSSLAPGMSIDASASYKVG
jgi:hypothetical protein